MRAPPLLLLLLMAGAGLAVSPLARFNPWLSACDLEEKGAGGEQAECSGEAACGAGGGGAGVLRASGVTRLCASPRRTTLLRELRLPTCCERSPVSVLDAAALAHVARGGESCHQALHDLLALDAMVATVHCQFASILGRYDCDQPYSVHTCDKCQTTYRRWACSTMIPFWVEEQGISADSVDTSDAGDSNDGRGRRSPAEHPARWRARHLERVGHLDRRRGGVVGRWVRAAAAGPGRPRYLMKPCLSVCQLVEQHCPYFLPADRAPAVPTQYAGEPTFLCLDARIPETGGQANNSNYGLESCCYTYCEENLCAQCSAEHALGERVRPTPIQCTPLETRVMTCPDLSLSPAARLRPAAILVALAAITIVLSTSLRTSPLVNVSDTRL